MTAYLQHSFGSSVLCRNLHEGYLIDQVVECKGRVEPVVDGQQSRLGRVLENNHLESCVAVGVNSEVPDNYGTFLHNLINSNYKRTVFY